MNDEIMEKVRMNEWAEIGAVKERHAYIYEVMAETYYC